jgi:hypothetical protein
VCFLWHRQRVVAVFSQLLADAQLRMESKEDVMEFLEGLHREKKLNVSDEDLARFKAMGLDRGNFVDVNVLDVVRLLCDRSG